MRPLSDRLTRLPLASGEGKGLDALLEGASTHSSYLAKRIERNPDWVDAVRTEAPEDLLKRLLSDLRHDLQETSDQNHAGALLRKAKSRSALLIALADLGGAWDLAQVTGALSDFADTAVDATADWLLARELAANRLPGLGEDDLRNGAGYCILAMGKHGARELNYSSDIDLICLFDQSRFDPDDFAEAKNRYIRLTRNLVQMLSETTERGYVLRTDLRLRPAPSTTPVCMAMEAAERYYESVGRTWERAAHIKARPIAGDIAAGRAYLDRLTPFVWRRYLDFAAIEDTHAMLRKIRETKGRFARAELGGTDIKLSPGGIREIEFFAQTRQLIQGGRDISLRDPTTRGALSALAQAGAIPHETAEQLSADYIAHRELEHRLQMVEDAQTHQVPRSTSARARIAALMGATDQDAWEQAISDRLARVHRTAEAFFRPDTEQRAAREEDQAATAKTLGAMGFARAEDTFRVVRRWQTGEIAATRDDRARVMYQGLEPRILRELGGAGDPDEAIAAFDRFLSGLPAGVQVFSLFTANPHLLDLLVRVCALAPRLAAYLGRNPQVLDALLDQDFFAPMPGTHDLAADLREVIGAEEDYERVLDAVRRWAREARFRVGVQHLLAMSDEVEAGRAFSAIAEAAIQVLQPRVAAEFARKHGPPPGRGLAVIAMGKLGSSEMTAGSDLDLIMVYDPGDAEASDGPKPLSVSAYFPRLTQAILAALTVPTAEGRLYEVDMRLRPSGRQGPVAVSLESFRRYQLESAWVWEHMALTRARVIAGDPGLCTDIEAVIHQALAARKNDPRIMVEAREMRERLAQAHADISNPWQIKTRPGGLLELEFTTQTGTLSAGLTGCRNARTAIPRLAEAGWLNADDAGKLLDALTLMQRIQQIERLALDGSLDQVTLGPGLTRRLCEAAQTDTHEALEAQIVEAQRTSAAIATRIFGED
ncbi:MAG: bifunctional [glutamine synthetase] adenylyltransferase/[glutamine synthetase]-adenylyl-L-tyrosine phosphorylase [Pseudomonadota bacterium]